MKMIYLKRALLFVSVLAAVLICFWGVEAEQLIASLASILYLIGVAAALR